MTLQEQHDANRKLYMDGKWTHEQFYLWLGEAIGVIPSDLPFSLEQIRHSKDKHLNDLPLHKWDMRDLRIRDRAYQAGMKAWSLSDSVCVLKAYARKLADSERAA